MKPILTLLTALLLAPLAALEAYRLSRLLRRRSASPTPALSRENT